MNADNLFKPRTSMFLLPITGVLFVLALLARGPLIDPGVDPAGFAQAVASPRFLAGALGWIIAWVLLLVSLLVIYAWLAGRVHSRLPLAGMLLSVVSIGLILSVMGVVPYLFPPAGAAYLRGQTGAASLMNEGFTSSVLVLGIFGLAVLAYIGGALLTGIAIWQARLLPRWVVILYWLHAPLIHFGPLFFVELAGALLLAIAAGGIAAGAGLGRRGR